MDAKISPEELGRHSTDDNGWTVINNTVWDLTGFAELHPGGEEAIHDALGRDGSDIYNSVHGPGLIARHLGEDKKVGSLGGEAAAATAPADAGPADAASAAGGPPLHTILNLYDMEAAASKMLSPRAWAYVSGASNDCLTLARNQDFYRRIMLRPRILRDVSTPCDTRTAVLGVPLSVPIINAPASLVKLVHTDGELVLARGLAAQGSTMAIPTMSSFAAEEIVAALPPGHKFFFQLYVHSSRRVAERLLRSVAKLKPSAILVTVDLPTMSKREANERYEQKAAADKAARGKARGQEKSTASPSRGVPGQNQARSAAKGIAANLVWQDLAWIRSVAGNTPIVVKGIQCAADALLALQHGCAGIYISNHGGRSADTAPPGILTLLEIQATCPQVLEQMEVFIDGGIRRGSDVFKAICLGASAVCLGRPFLYAAAYGPEGVEHVMSILRDELQTAMQLTGITNLSDAHPGLLNTSALDKYVYRSEAHPYAKKIVRSKI